MIYDNFIKLCAAAGKTPSAVAKEIGINKSAVSNWKKRTNGPSDVTIEKLAQYFNVPVSELTGEGQKNKPDSLGVELTDMQKEAMEFVMSLSDEQLEQFVRVGRAMIGGNQ